MEIKTFKEWETHIAGEIENDISKHKFHSEYFSEEDEAHIVHFNESIKLVSIKSFIKELKEIEDIVKTHQRDYCEDYQLGYFDVINRLRLVIKHYSNKTENTKEVSNGKD